jgi:putative transposase
MDFVADQLVDGRRFRALTVNDLFTRECLAIDAGQSLSGRDVVATLERLRFERGLPQRIYCDEPFEVGGSRRMAGSLATESTSVEG